MQWKPVGKEYGKNFNNISHFAQRGIIDTKGTGVAASMESKMCIYIREMESSYPHSPTPTPPAPI